MIRQRKNRRIKKNKKYGYEIIFPSEEKSVAKRKYVYPIIKLNKCLHCGIPVRLKYCSVSCQNRHQKIGIPLSSNAVNKGKLTRTKKWNTFIVKCHKCELEFEIKEYKVSEPKKEKYFCSRKCANSRSWTQEDRNKISIIARNSQRVKEANKNNTNRKFRNGKPKLKDILIIENSICLFCNELIIHKNIYKKSKYHRKCWDKVSGGCRQGSSRGKHGWYHGYWCDSSYELAFVIYCLEHGDKIERNRIGFDYVLDNKKRKFYPDFTKNGGYVEIKNFRSRMTDEKIKQFPYPIEVLYKDDLKKEILPYVIEKYGKKFIELYEGNPYELRTRKCLNCGNDCRGEYCNRKCASIFSGKRRRKLSDDQIDEIKLKYKNGICQKELAKIFGMSQTTISEIVRGKKDKK